MKQIQLDWLKLLLISFISTSFAQAQAVSSKNESIENSSSADADWKSKWKTGETACYSAQDGFGKEWEKYCYEVLNADDGAVSLGRWRGTSKDRPEKASMNRGRFTFQKNTGLVGHSGGGTLRYAPFETIGCLPIRAGKNCMESLDKPVIAEVNSAQFPQWRTAELKEAKYAQKSEKFVLANGNVIEVLRMTARFRRNDGGDYIRQALYRADGTSLLPVAWVISFYSSYASGQMEHGHMGFEFFLRTAE